MTGNVYKRQKLWGGWAGIEVIIFAKRQNIYKMGLFSKNKENESDLIVKVKLISIELEKLALKYENLEQNFKSLRGLVNRKLGNDPESVESPQSKDIYSGMLLPE